ncbi:AI-2E family transporter [Secundilactobacillus collinoides]|uniref:AI-2E family transporter n=1 Tax=Secundilactobacillus collinoides TaxID=33960 RepID=UPI000704A719|nr:AI-2E family transporter [Secundilactobacillus collinoides]
MKQSRQPVRSWFSNWFLNNKAVVSLIILLLILLNLFMLSKLPWLWSPLKGVATLLGIPIMIAGVGYYLLNPLVDRLENQFHVNRLITIAVVFILILGLIIWGVVTLIPIVQAQVVSLLANWPRYWSHLEDFLTQWVPGLPFEALHKQLTNFNDEIANVLKGRGSTLVSTSLTSIAGVVSRVSTALIAVITAPFILFYLLKDGHQLPKYLTHFVPFRKRASVLRVLTNMNRQVSNYIRGQLTVAFFVGAMFAFGYWVIGLKFALLLGIVSGILNLIPYLGSFLAMVPAITVGAFVSPLMLVKVLIVFVIEQTLEGRVISPLVLGNTLAIHPVTIIFILLAAGKLFGIAGVILGIPGYAVIKVIVNEWFDWYRQHSDFDAGDPDSSPSEKQDVHSQVPPGK